MIGLVPPINKHQENRNGPNSDQHLKTLFHGVRFMMLDGLPENQVAVKTFTIAIKHDYSSREIFWEHQTSHGSRKWRSRMNKRKLREGEIAWIGPARLRFIS